MIWVGLCLLLLVFAMPFWIEARRKPVDASFRNAAPGRFTTLSQGVTHYDWIGPETGPVAICVHGLTTPSYVWRGVAQGLADDGYRVLIYDLYGRGYSDRPAGLQDRAFFLRQLDDLLNDQDVNGKFVLLGHSMGGAIATHFAAAHPARIAQLILVTPAGIMLSIDRLTRFIVSTPVIGDWLMYAFYPRQLRAYTEAERNLPTSVPDITDMQQAELDRKGFVPAVLSSMRGFLIRPLRTEHESLRAAGVPVRAIWGRLDPVIPISAKDRLAEWNPDAQQHVVDAGGHGLPYTDTEEILRFLRNTTGS